MKAVPRGLFLTIEGGEGSGKSSLVHHLVAWLELRSIRVLQTREPGGTPIAEALRELLLNAPVGQGMLPMTELLLMIAARHEHVEKIVRPALIEGTTVVCDRYIDSTMAYQAFGRGRSPDQVWNLCVDLVPLLPDLTFYLDVAPEVALPRLHKRQRDVRDRLESEDTHFHERVREGFLTMARKCPSRVVVLDASLPEPQLAYLAVKVLEKKVSVL